MDINELIPNARMLTANKTQELETALVARQSKARYTESGQKRLYLSTRGDNQELCQ